MAVQRIKNSTSINKRGCLARLRGVYRSLNPAGKKVVDYILAHPEETIGLSITEVAENSSVSEATVVRVSQLIGYQGFQELKIVLAKDLGSFFAEIPEKIKRGDSVTEITAKVLQMNIQAIRDTLDVLDVEEVEKAIKAISNARRVDFYGVGASGFVALDAQNKFLRINIESMAFTDPHSQAVSAALLTKRDVAVGISHSGSTKDIADSLFLAKSAGATTICITNYARSPVAKISDIKLYTASKEATFRSGAIASRIAQLSVIDVLFMGILIRCYDKTVRCLEKTTEAVKTKRY
ncbi:MAG: MurR/RpiR family transcriptional regulator [Candidatus Aerophobetes bacterium]|nr:MurR/RpiR family transcriptional regulator [Candidatus Aerophobetes bacterium]